MANNTLIGALRAEATLESGKFVDGAKKIRKEAKATEVQVKQSFGSMGASVKGFSTALTAGLSIGLLGGVIKKSLDFATSIKDVAKQVGVTTKELQEFRYAASQVGIQQAEADKGLEKLNLTLGKAAAGSKSAKEALAAVGVTMKDVQTKSKPEIFGQIADNMIKQGGAAKNAAAANAIFGESAAKLNPLLDRGSEGINELSAAAQRLGVVLSDQQIQQADETARKLDDVKRVLAAQIAGVVADNASSIISLAGALGQLTSEIIKFLNSNPTAALAIIGALAVGRIGGLPGAAAGAVAGAGIGIANFDPNKQFSPDQKFLRSRFIQEAEVLKQMRAGRTGALDPATAAQAAKVKRLRDRFVASGGSIPGSGGGFGSLPQFLAPSAGGGRKGRTARGPRDRSDDVSFSFDMELQRAQVDVLRAQQQLARTSEERAAIALKLLDAERAMQEAELNDRVRRAERDFAEGKITAGTLEQVKVQAEKLRAEYDSRDALEREAIADDLAADKAQEAAQLVDAGYELELEKLQIEGSLAETTDARLDVELRMLDIMKEQEKARLEAVIADKDSSETAKKIAEARLKELDAIYAGKEDAARMGNRSPLQDYKARYTDIAQENEEAFVNMLEDVSDALSKATDGLKSLKESLLNTFKTFFQTLLKNQLNQLFASLIPTGGISFGGGGVPGFATGGSMLIRGVPGIDRNTLSLNGMPIARVSDMERLTISNDNVRGRSAHDARGGVTVNINGVSDFDSFARNKRQVGRSARRELGV